MIVSINANNIIPRSQIVKSLERSWRSIHITQRTSQIFLQKLIRKCSSCLFLGHILLFLCFVFTDTASRACHLAFLHFVLDITLQWLIKHSKSNR